MIILSEESDEVEQPPETHVPYQLEAPKEETVNVTAENACVQPVMTQHVISTEAQEAPNQVESEVNPEFQPVESSEMQVQEEDKPKATAEVPPPPIQVESDESELNENLLQEQASDQDFSDQEDEPKKEDAFEEGSEDLNMITVTNPILFTEHIPIMGRVPLSKYTSQRTFISSGL